jgi:type IV fimbrial biogenesis protein FimT
MKTHASGFTMVEMLVVLAILAILAAIAAPNMGTMVRTQRVKTASFDVFAGLVLARSEALKRNTTVTVTPVGGNWANGWTATDSNGNTVRKQSGFTTVSITGPATVVFTGSGRLSGGSSPQFALSAADVATENQRCVKVDLSGRPVSIQGACT